MKIPFFTLIICLALVFVLSPVEARGKSRQHVAGVEMIPIKLGVVATRATKAATAVSTAQADLHAVIALLPKTTGNSFRGIASKVFNKLPT